MNMQNSAVSAGYSDLVERQFQNDAMAGFPVPPRVGEDMSEFWKDTVNYSYEGVGVDASSRWAGAGAGYHPIMNEWILSSINPNKDLSLSLATSHPLHGTTIQDQASDLTSSAVTTYSCNSYNPFPVSESRFFQPMQEILAQFACQISFSPTGSDHRLAFAGRGGTRNGFSDELDSGNTFLFHSNVESKKKHLLSLLQLVDDQYNQCLDEIHTVISAFHAVTELDPNLHTRFALPAISLMYRNLKERISSHILAMGASHSEGDARENSSFETSFIQKQWALQQLKKREHQLWRPQRGLPERSVSVLRAWMFQNFLHPYPKDAEKHLLALKSGLTRSQVSNWFINARVRLWKPMIEEMYAEMNRRKARRNEEETNGSHRNHLRFDSRRFAVD